MPTFPYFLICTLVPTPPTFVTLGSHPTRVAPKPRFINLVDGSTTKVNKPRKPYFAAPAAIPVAPAGLSHEITSKYRLTYHRCRASRYSRHQHLPMPHHRHNSRPHRCTATNTRVVTVGNSELTVKHSDEDISVNPLHIYI